MLMEIQITHQAETKVACDALVVAVAAEKKAGQKAKSVVLSEVAKTLDEALGGVISEMCANGEIKASLGELNTIHTLGKLAAKRVVIVGLGPRQALSTEALRRASAIATRHLQHTGADEIAGAQAQVEGALLGLYSFRKYQQADTNSNGRGVTGIKLLSEDADEVALNQAIERGSVFAEATNFARDLVNEPPNVLTPTELAHRASTMAKQFGMECEVLDRPQMQELGMGGLLGVAQGSAEPPKFIILRYRGAPNSIDKGMALVGKGITFDTGGISIKPAERMHEMKGDMSGAAAVIGAMQIIGALKHSINVTALVSATENMPSGTAYRPGDILRIMNGKTIEIINTDAEGRLVLADALS